ncbi:TraR/DksA family transcriptional regulator [Rhodovibrionaceae bacterium A322]
MDEKTLESFRQLLLDREKELNTLDTQTGDSRAPVELDQSRVGRLSRMDALQGQAMAQATHGRRQAELQRIKAAFERIDSDDYGWCLSCGEEIAEARLKADPAVPLCVHCADRG